MNYSENKLKIWGVIIISLSTFELVGQSLNFPDSLFIKDTIPKTTYIYDSIFKVREIQIKSKNQKDTTEWDFGYYYADSSLVFNNFNRLFSLKTFINAKKNGTFFQWYNNGKLWKVENYYMGIEIGTWLEWYENGNLLSMGDYGYSDADKNLKYRFMANTIDLGIPPYSKAIGNLGYKRLNGTWTYWYPNGQINKIENYSNGKKIGNWTEYYENGLPKCKGSYSSDSNAIEITKENVDSLQKLYPDFWVAIHCILDIKNGKWIYYSMDGKLIKEEFWNHGILMNKKEY